MGTLHAMPERTLSKADLEAMARMRYQMVRYLRFSEEAARSKGVTLLQYLLMLQCKGFPGREWASLEELAERLQAKHHVVVGIVSRCEAAGLVTLCASRTNRRDAEVHLTRHGEQCLERLVRLHQAELRPLQEACLASAGTSPEADPPHLPPAA